MGISSRRLAALSGLVVCLCAALAYGTSAGASTHSTSGGSCKGKPLTLMAITNLSAPVSEQEPAYPDGMRAAAAAVTKSCELSAPVKVISCDDQYNPNTDAQCAREAVADKVTAVMAYTGLGDVYGPILTKAGIPFLSASSVSSTENTSKLSYAMGFSLTNTLAEVQLAAATGGHTMVLGALDIPAVTFILNLVKETAKSFGITVKPTVEIPLTATDMTQYAAQLKNSGADTIVPYVGPIQLIPLLKALYADGVTGKNTRIIDSTAELTPPYAKQLGPAINGVLAVGSAVSPTDMASPAVRQYISELKADGEPHSGPRLDMLGVVGWGSVHVLADALHSEGLSATHANVVKALNKADIPALTLKYGISPVNFAKNQLHTAGLTALRIFSQYNTDWQYNAAGIPEPLAGGNQVSVYSTQKISR